MRGSGSVLCVKGVTLMMANGTAIARHFRATSPSTQTSRGFNPGPGLANIALRSVFRYPESFEGVTKVYFWAERYDERDLRLYSIASKLTLSI